MIRGGEQAAHIRSKIAAMPWPPPAQREHDALADHRGHIRVGDADSWLIVLLAARPKFPLRNGSGGFQHVCEQRTTVCHVTVAAAVHSIS
jgi:hypothetical protein